jgi:hypothetical protein
MVASPQRLGPEKDCAGKASNIYKRQTRPVVRGGAPQKQDRNYQTGLNIYLVSSPRWGSIPRLNWLTDRQSQCDFDFDFLQSVVSRKSEWELGVESPGGFNSREYKDENGTWIVKINWVHIRTEANSKLCKSAIALYSLCLSVIKRDCNQSAN